MDRWQNRVAVVTGASSGIGAAIVKDLAKAGLIVVGLARRVEKIEEIRAGLPRDLQKRIHAVKCDVSSEQSVEMAFEWIVRTLGGVDILVNNAGTATAGKLATLPLAEVRKIVDTNLIGVVACTQQAFKSMKARNFDGHILMVNSILGHSIPILSSNVDLNIYPSTKYGITAMTEVLRQEFKALDTNIKITSISPGLVNTEIIRDEVRDYFKNCMLAAEDISSGVLYAISTPPHVQVHELTIKPMGERM